MPKRLVLLIFSFALLTSCGFHLRGNYVLPTALSEISVEGGNPSFTTRLTNQLEKSGSTVFNEDDSVATLLITDNSYSKKVRTLDARGLATGYDYTYRVVFSVVGADDKALLPKTSLSQKRSLEFDAQKILELEKEEAFNKEEMEKELVLQVMRKLSRI